jgi:3-oxoacyl-[acyl-carrier protein] reductase
MNKEVVLVSGGSKGLGLAIVRALLERGDSVATFARRSTPEIEALIDIYSDRFDFAESDMLHSDTFRVLVKQFEQKLGGLTGLVNNAATVAEAILARQDSADILKLLQTNLAGPLLLTREVARGMMIRQRGRIVNISSIVSVSGYKGTAAYSATKGGLNAMTRALARELGGRGITVNAVAPGFMLTDLVKHQLEKPGGTDWYMKRAPMGRGGDPDEIAGPIVFLACPMASYVTGVVMPVDGGFLSA